MNPDSLGQHALVVPCYNEANRLQTNEYVAFLRKAPGTFHMVFVDDGSSDSTLSVIERVRSEVGNDRVTVLRMPQNGGKAEAVRYGMNYALNQGGAEVVGFWDADLATPLPTVYDLLTVMKQSPRIHMVFGARVKLLGRQIERRAARHYLGRIFATVVSRVLKLPVYDTQCGAKLFRVTPELKEVLHDRFLSRWIFDVEIIARFVQKRGGRWVQDAIYEYPLHEWKDVAGSKVKPGDFVKSAAEIFAIWNRYLRHVRQSA